LHTGIGYWLQEDQYKDGSEQVMRQNQVYSELGYGSGKSWEITARVGMSDLNLPDAFSSSTPATSTSKRDFQEHWKFFGTAGAKGFHPFNQTFGMGVFIQGTYYFSDFSDNVSGNRNGVPFSADLAVRKLWDVNFGAGFQATLLRNVKLYAGPYVHYAEFKAVPSSNVTGIALVSGETTLKNKTAWGGFAGIELPLAMGFSLNMEGQFSERFSFGGSILYAY